MYIYIYIYIYIFFFFEQKIWGCRLVKSHFSQLVLAYGLFQGNFFIFSDVRFMLCLIFPDEVFLSSLQ